MPSVQPIVQSNGRLSVVELSVPQDSRADSVPDGQLTTTSGGVCKSMATDSNKANKWISECMIRDRTLKEAKILVQRRLVHFHEAETLILEANLKEARQLYESQLVEQRLVDWRQKAAADDLLRDEERKGELVRLVNKMGALKVRLNMQDEARDREVAFREKVKLKREGHQSRVKKIEARQKKEREELVSTQKRVARNLKIIQEVEVRGMDEMKRRAVLREFEIQSQQLAMRQQKEAEQLREVQLLKVRHMSEAIQLELVNMAETEEVAAEQRMKEIELDADHRMQVQSEEDKLDRQQAKLKALQMKEEQKIQRNQLKHNQRRQVEMLDRQQRTGIKLRERSMLAENSATLGGDLLVSGSDADGSESMGDSYATSDASRSENGGADDDQEVDNETRAATENNAAGDAENRRRRRATNDAEEEIAEALAKGRERVVNLLSHQRKMVDEIKSYHRDVRDQKTREQKRKMNDLTKDHEDEMRSVKTEQAQEMEELLEAIGNRDLIDAQASSFDKQLDTVVSNQLLSNMLPKHVADELKAGRTPEPTSFDLVSLFFTDIEGFKELANRSSPHQIVALLNRMYIAFDDVISTFPDLYKVETVMDSFMVCSGLSGGAKKKSREDKISDASVAADCALALLRAVGKIDMSDQLVDRVNLRIGIQCGPILAGVIGTKMPHYCLFGDTVNTASRMCSTSESLKLQISQDMYELLSDTYVCEARGTISVKGKGEMNTYYLTGKKGSR